jgi:predicted flavoprotein YhiN
VTAGGVDAAELTAGTLESKIVPGLFLAGEVIDVDADCGGYNLQWAWSSGQAAGVHAAGN